MNRKLFDYFCFMKSLTIEIKESKFEFIMELLKSFSFVRVATDKKLSAEKQETLLSIARGIREAKLASQGKIKSRPAKEFLNEL
jgi:cobalamin-dependent methionine synthase I